MENESALHRLKSTRGKDLIQWSYVCLNAIKTSELMEWEKKIQHKDMTNLYYNDIDQLWH